MRERSILSPAPTSPPQAGMRSITAADLVRRQARRLQRASQSESIADAMPALRRVHAAGVLPDLALGTLYRERRALKRKHFLRALAVEAGFPDWERFRPHLDSMPPEDFEHFKVSDEWFVFLNSWLSNKTQARSFAAAHGGRVLRVGTQAVVVAPDAQAEGSAGSAP